MTMHTKQSAEDTAYAFTVSEVENLLYFNPDHFPMLAPLELDTFYRKLLATVRENVALRADVEELQLRMNKLRDKAVLYLDRAEPFSTDGQADSCIRADLQRELAVMAMFKRK